jgi:hypothetical protein
MAIEAPCERGVIGEPAGVRELVKAQPEVAVRGVRAPEALGSAKVGEAGVHAHAGTGGDDDGLRITHEHRSARDLARLGLTHGQVVASVRR